MRWFLFVLSTLFYFSSAQAQVANVGNSELSKLISEGVPVIDIRRAEEWRQTGIVEGSHLLTFFDKKGRYDLNKWMAEFSKIAGKDDRFILICRTGNRTGMISRFLDEKLKYSKVGHVQKGITKWIAEGNPVVKPEI